MKSSPDSARRLWTLGLVAGASAAAGVGWQWLRSGEPASALAGGPADIGQAGTPDGLVRAATAAATDLWTQRFDRPEGGELVLSTLRGKPLLVNFWATWCPPCVKEMPQIDRFARENAQGVQVVGLAVDGPSPVREFLKKTPVSFRIGLAGFGGTELARALGNPAGALPFSVLLNARGDVVQRKLGETRLEELTQWAAGLRA